MKKIAVIRDSRISALDHYKYFKNSEVMFVSANNQPHDIAKYNLPSNVSLINLRTYNPLLFDPASLLYNKIFNLSWKYIEDLELTIKGTDIINLSDTYYFWNYQSIQIAKQRQIPVVTNIWCNTPHHISSWLPPYSWITKEVVDNTDLFILRNQKAREFTISLGIPEKKTEVIYKGIDLNRFKPANIQQEQDNIIRILYIGLLDESKGLTDLLTAFQFLQPKHSNIELIIAGRGKLQSEIEKLSLKLPINFKQFVNYYDIPKLYQQADIFCSPSRSVSIAGIPLWGEYFSYTLMEAQAAALPIITTSVGGISEEVDNNNLFVQEKSPQQIAQALEKLILDSRMRKQLGLSNRQRAEQLFNGEKQAFLTEKRILQLIP